MIRWTHALTATFLLAIPLLATGCSTSGGGGHDHAAMSAGGGDKTTMTMMCPKCETVWVATAGPHGPRHITAYSRTGKMVCPDCDKAAHDAMMGDGKTMMHDCPTCKAAPVALKSYEPSGPRP